MNDKDNKNCFLLYKKTTPSVFLAFWWLGSKCAGDTAFNTCTNTLVFPEIELLQQLGITLRSILLICYKILLLHTQLIYQYYPHL
jgi:hypothetical protein